MFAYSPPAFDFRTQMSPADGSLSVIRPNAFVPVLVCGAPRELQSFAAGAAMMRRPGCYILLREGDEPGDLPRCNIGEGEPVGGRVVTKIETGVWEWVAVITCDQPHFTKVHAEHLEMRVTACAEGARRVVVERDRAPKRRQMPATDEAALDEMVGVIRRMLAARGYPFLEHEDLAPAGLSSGWQHRSLAQPVEKPADPFVRPAMVPEAAPRMFQRDADHAAPGAGGYTLRYRDLGGTAFEDARGFHVMCGTEVSGTETQTLPDLTKRRRIELREEGILVRHPFDSAKLVFARNHSFENGTCAAKIVAGSKQCWRTVWIEREHDRAREGLPEP